MNKTNLLQQILATLEHDLKVASSVLAATHEAATHSESRAENKYDTRGLEAAYLADGQRRRLHEIEQALAKYRSLSVTNASEQIRVGSLIEVEADQVSRWLYLGPDAAGLKVSVQGQMVFVLTAQSPLGAGLLGKEEGDEIAIKTEGKTLVYAVLSVL